MLLDASFDMRIRTYIVRQNTFIYQYYQHNHIPSKENNTTFHIISIFLDLLIFFLIVTPLISIYKEWNRMECDRMFGGPWSYNAIWYMLHTTWCAVPHSVVAPSVATRPLQEIHSSWLHQKKKKGGHAPNNDA